MKISCEVVQDLLPLYHDGVCSKDSSEIVDTHLQDCEACKKMLADMDADIMPGAIEELKSIHFISKGVFDMLKIFKKAFWVPYEDSTTFPTAEKAHQAIAKYCKGNGYSYAFTGADEVVINGVAHEIYRGLEPGSRGNYGIKCREK